MTWLDRLLVAFVRLGMTLLNRRLSTAHRRVWWVSATSLRARPNLFPDGVPEEWPAEEWAGVISVAFGSPGPRGHDSPPRPLLEIMLTRRMLDMFTDGAIEVRNRQDIQLAALREESR